MNALSVWKHDLVCITMYLYKSLSVVLGQCVVVIYVVTSL